MRSCCHTSYIMHDCNIVVAACSLSLLLPLQASSLSIPWSTSPVWLVTCLWLPQWLEHAIHSTVQLWAWQLLGYYPYFPPPFTVAYLLVFPLRALYFSKSFTHCLKYNERCSHILFTAGLAAHPVRFSPKILAQLIISSRWFWHISVLQIVINILQSVHSFYLGSRRTLNKIMWSLQSHPRRNLSLNLTMVMASSLTSYFSRSSMYWHGQSIYNWTHSPKIVNSIYCWILFCQIETELFQWQKSLSCSFYLSWQLDKIFWQWGCRLRFFED